MFWPFGIKNKKKPNFPKRNKKVILLVDWENLFYCLHQRSNGTNMRIEYRIKKLLEWVCTEIGETMCSIVFAPEHLSADHRKIWADNGFKIMICPKKQLDKPERNPKSGQMETLKDTVDETLIWFATMMFKHPDTGYICLVSGDDDYVPMMEEAKKLNVKRALAPPTIGSLSKSQGLVKTFDRHPFTGRRMILRLDQV
ncbi:MAG: NYN domain-containing protein [Candidatus Staskawiczbacteria bacterium]